MDTKFWLLLSIGKLLLMEGVMCWFSQASKEGGVSIPLHYVWLYLGGGKRKDKWNCFSHVCLKVGRKRKNNIFDHSFVWFARGRENERKKMWFELETPNEVKILKAYGGKNKIL